MKLEFNLLRIDGIDASIGASLKRSYSDNIDAPFEEILSFLKSIKDYLKVVPELANNIESAKSLSAVDFQCIRYILNLNNLDIMVRYVEDEIELAKGKTELVLTNYNDIVQGFIPKAMTKLVDDEDLDVEEAFRLIDSAYKLFDGDVFKGISDPFIEQVNNIAPAEVMMNGEVPKSLIEYCNSIISYIGIEIFRIVPNE
jgi:uncharacterized radical SAM superfamily protein